MKRVGIIFALIVLVSAQEQPQLSTENQRVLQQAPIILSTTPTIVPQTSEASSGMEEDIPTKKENEKVASPFSIINSMYDIAPLRVKVFNWFSSWFAPSGTP